MTAPSKGDGSNDTSTIYLVAATGGLEDPSFVSFTDRAEAEETYRTWTEELANEPGDRIDLIAIDTIARTTSIQLSFVYDE